MNKSFNFYQKYEYFFLNKEPLAKVPNNIYLFCKNKNKNINHNFHREMNDYQFSNDHLVYLTEKIKCLKITSSDELCLFFLPSSGFVQLALNREQQSIKKLALK